MKPSQLTVIPPGAEVLLADASGHVAAVVLEVAISGDIDMPRVQYKVAWWSRSTRNAEWIDAIEVRSKAGVTSEAKIGFQCES